SPYSILNGYLTASLVVIIALFIYIFTHYDIRPALRYKSEWIKYLMFSLPALPTLLSSWFFTYVDRYFISYYSGTGEVGIYSLAYTLGSLPMFFVSPLGTVLFPVLSKLWDEKKYVEGKRKVQSSMFAFLIFGIPFLVIIFFFSKSLLTFISANSEFGVQGRWITPIVALSHIFFGLIYLLNYFYYSIKKTYYITIIFVIGAAINFITNLWFVPKYGSLGAAVTTLLSFVLMFIITLVFIVKLGFKHEK
ncbi:MAG: oligosaccharide flippase family protein, partial [Candidatus Hodarchaeota archaeon]